MQLRAELSGNTEDLVVAIQGTLPIVLTAPHGGECRIPSVPERTRGETVQDTRTYELATALQKHFTKTFGAQPYIVAARFHRRYLDANREESDAFESAAAKPLYVAYHNRIAEFISAIKKTFEEGLLLDIHGQGVAPRTIYRGTCNGLTTRRLVDRHGLEALVGRSSVLGFLEAEGYSVFPSGAERTTPEDGRFVGGYTVRTYGSHRPGGIDAIQLELGRRLRDSQHLVPDLAEAIMAFHNAYLR